MRITRLLRRFLSIGGSVVPQRQIHQPVPQVSSFDVERVARREFKNDFTTVMALLNDLETARIKLAVLKLADGSVEKLRSNIDSAKCDYRDVLAPAEYPEYCKRGFRVSEWPAEERSRIIESDWRQYEDWLRK